MAVSVPPTSPASKASAAIGRAGGRFVRGVSGNPTGRPTGSRNRTSELCHDLLGVDAEAIMAIAITRAKAGDPVALRLCIERLVPIKAARDRAVLVDLPAVRVAADLVTAAATVIQEAAAGRLTLSEAREFMSLLDAQRHVMETGELAVRIELLENAGGGALAPPCSGSNPLALQILERVRIRSKEGL